MKKEKLKEKYQEAVVKLQAALRRQEESREHVKELQGCLKVEQRYQASLSLKLHSTRLEAIRLKNTILVRNNKITHLESCLPEGNALTFIGLSSKDTSVMVKFYNRLRWAGQRAKVDPNTEVFYRDGDHSLSLGTVGEASKNTAP